jgi:uncharacterized protein with von Willebrand factor type A (vWA) domain
VTRAVTTDAGGPGCAGGPGGPGGPSSPRSPRNPSNPSSPRDPGRGDRVVVAFATSLRRAGLRVPSGSVVAFAEALGAVGLEQRSPVYWAGRATLVRKPEDVPTFDRVFSEFFDRRPSEAGEALPVSLTLAIDDEEESAEEEPEAAEAPEEGRTPALAVTYSAVELLRREDFARYGDQEWDEARRLIAAMRSRAETRRSRRVRAAGRGSALDLPRTVRAALASDGEAVRRAWLSESVRQRRVVLLVDISGSMEPYARAFLRFAHAALVSRPTGSVEVFVFGTRVSRITRQLATRDPDAALADAAKTVEDWYGGTRLGEGLRTFNDRWGTRGTARGSIVVVLSDGWDRGDPELFATEMQRLRRVAHRIVWVNPLRASAGYEPLARGMAAALPYVDDFVDGHSIASLEALVEVIAGEQR